MRLFKSSAPTSLKAAIVNIVISRRDNILNIDLYTTHCPKCRVLEKKLAAKNITYTEHDDINEMINLGYKETPVLVVDGHKYSSVEAIKWVNSVEV